MKILWIATKIPWPARDGGRLLLWNTLRALAEDGCDLTLVAPTLGRTADAARAAAELEPWCRLLAVPARLRPRALDAFRALVLGRPWTAVRHRLPAMQRRVAEILRSERFDLVQAEQVQALGSLPPEVGVPVVWRAQNVESDLWTATAERSHGLRRAFLGHEAGKLARWEGEKVRQTAATLALTAEDAARLTELAGPGGSVHRVPAPFETSLPAAEQPLDGAPAVVLFGSGGWLPNRRAGRWFVERAWPRVRERLPRAVLHIYGGERPGRRELSVRWHPPPADSRDAFPPAGVQVVPLDVASGVRMKILEAWARGVPVVATPPAARGLSAEDGRALLLARSADEFAGALERLQDPALRRHLAEHGRRLLHREHRPAEIARRLRRLYETLTSESSTGRSSGAASGSDPSRSGPETGSTDPAASASSASST